MSDTEAPRAPDDSPSVADDGPSKEAPPVDPGCLPAWDVDDFPEPQQRRTNWVKLLGPGLVLAGGSIGTGEWIVGPQAAARYHGAFMWAALASLLAQVVLNTEVMRYAVCTGEPILTGFMRTKPGPKFWLAFYLLLDAAGWFPSLAGLAAQILVVWVQGLTPADTINPHTVRMVSYIVFLSCAFMALFGGKIYNTLQLVLGSKVAFVLGYTAFACIFFVSASTWAQMWGGLINPMTTSGMTSSGIDWAIVSALAGFAGLGGTGNAMASNFVRENGWGMGSKVGAIPSAFGGHKIELSHIGVIARNTAENARRFNLWFRYIITDQYYLWFGGSLVAMMLPAMLGAEYLKVENLDASADRWKWAAALAQDFGVAKGEIFRHLTLLCGLVIMIPGQFYVVDITARRWTDVIWSGSRRARKLNPDKVKHVYYGIAGVYTVWGVCAYTFFPKLDAGTMLIIAGNMANLTISMTILQTLYVNRTFLPEYMRPSAAKQLALVVSALFFLSMFGLVVVQKVIPTLRKEPQAAIILLTVVVVILSIAYSASCRSVRSDPDQLVRR